MNEKIMEYAIVTFHENRNEKMGKLKILQNSVRFLCITLYSLHVQGLSMATWQNKIEEAISSSLVLAMNTHCEIWNKGMKNYLYKHNSPSISSL